MKKKKQKNCEEFSFVDTCFVCAAMYFSHHFINCAFSYHRFSVSWNSLVHKKNLSFLFPSHLFKLNKVEKGKIKPASFYHFSTAWKLFFCFVLINGAWVKWITVAGQFIARGWNYEGLSLGLELIFFTEEPKGYLRWLAHRKYATAR